MPGDTREFSDEKRTWKLIDYDWNILIAIRCCLLFDGTLLSEHKYVKLVQVQTECTCVVYLNKRLSSPSVFVFRARYIVMAL